MKAHFSLFQLYQNKRLSCNPLRIHTRNHNIPLLKPKNTINSNEKSSCYTIEANPLSSFRFSPKPPNRRINFSNPKTISLHQSMNNPQMNLNPKASLSKTIKTFNLNSLLYKSQDKRKVENFRKRNKEHKEKVNSNPNQIRYFLQAKEKYNPLTYKNLFGEYKGNLSNKNGTGMTTLSKLKQNNISTTNQYLKPEVQSQNNTNINNTVDMTMKKMYSPSSVTKEQSHDISSDKNENKKKDNSDDDEKEKEKDHSGILSMDDVKDIIIYHDFEELDKSCDDLFAKNDYNVYIKTKAKDYVSLFALDY